MSAANAARRSYRYFLATMRWAFNNNKHNNHMVVLCWGWCGDWRLLWWSWWWWWWFSTFCALRFMLSELNKAQAKRQQNFPQVCFDSDCDSAILKCNLYYRNNCFRFEAKCDKNNKPLKKCFSRAC